MQETPTEKNISRILCALRVLLVPATPGEYDLHALVACALKESGLGFTHEARLGPGCRVDFLCDTIAIEVKKGKPQKSALVKQIQKYIAFDEVSGLIVVSQKNVSLRTNSFAKPVSVLCLDKLWGVALP